MMVALLLYAYAVGELIARFRAREARPLADLFVQVLALCAKAGMVRVGTVAIDGTKLSADAGLGANRSHAKMRAEVDRILAEAAAVDAAEDERLGDARGDELPAEMADPRSRRARLDRAIGELEAEHQARVDEHQAILDRRAAHRQRTGKNPRGRPPGDGPDPRQLAASKRNVTDPDSRIMSARGAHVQAYNAQAVVSEDQIILAAAVTSDANDRNQLKPMLDAARANLKTIAFDAKIKAALADGDYWNNEQIAELQSAKTTVVIPPEDRHHRGPRKHAPADRIDKILATAAGKRFYRRRAAIVEPVFAQTKHNRGIDRFHRRGRQAVDAEWKPIAATHNMLKYIRQRPQIA